MRLAGDNYPTSAILEGGRWKKRLVRIERGNSCVYLLVQTRQQTERTRLVSRVRSLTFARERTEKNQPSTHGGGKKGDEEVVVKEREGWWSLERPNRREGS